MEKKEQHFALIAIVAIVAIIAIVVLVMNIYSNSVIAGEAYKTSYTTTQVAVTDDISKYVSKGILSLRLGNAIDKWVDSVDGGLNICHETALGCAGTCGSGTSTCHLGSGGCCCRAGC